MTAEELPEPDRIEGAPHPRETARLFGQHSAERAFLDAWHSGRLHHAWLLTGPRGIGKATLAWRIARFLLADGSPIDPGLFAEPEAEGSLDVAPDHPVARRILAGAEPRLFPMRRSWDADRKRLKSAITVDEVRKLGAFLHLSAADGGRRVAIVDAADEMNNAAANALLKMLEEPPADVTFLLVSHQPSRLLPTIRSRCRELRLSPLSATDLAAAMDQAGTAPQGEGALAELAAGSVGEAIRLVNLDGLSLYSAIVGLFDTLPRLDRGAVLKFADLAAQRGDEARIDLIFDLLALFLARMARAGTGRPCAEAAPGEAALASRLVPDVAAARRWAELQAELGARIAHGRAVNLDPGALMLDAVLRIEQVARDRNAA